MSTTTTGTTTAPSTAPVRPTLASSARGELTKATSLRATWWCAAVSVAALGGLPALLMLQGGTASPADLAVGSGLALMVAMAMAAVLSTSDLQHGTFLVTRWADPHRWHGFWAKVLTVGVGGGLVGLLGGVLALGLGVVTGTVPSVGVDEVRATVGQAPVFALATALAAGIGLLVKRTGFAVAAVIIWIQLIESLAPALPQVGETVRAWLPFMNAFMFTMPGNFASAPHSPALALAYFAGVCLALLAVTGLVTTRRDV